jgi:ribose transport system permease protein
MTDTSPIDGPTHAKIDESIALRQEMSGFQAAIRTQPFWVFIAILAIGVVMSFVSATGR